MMREAGLLETEKRGLNVYYRLRCRCLLSFFACIDSLLPAEKDLPEIPPLKRRL